MIKPLWCDVTPVNGWSRRVTFFIFSAVGIATHRGEWQQSSRSATHHIPCAMKFTSALSMVAYRFAWYKERQCRRNESSTRWTSAKTYSPSYKLFSHCCHSADGSINVVLSSGAIFAHETCFSLSAHICPPPSIFAEQKENVAHWLLSHKATKGARVLLPISLANARVAACNKLRDTSGNAINRHHKPWIKLLPPCAPAHTCISAHNAIQSNPPCWIAAAHYNQSIATWNHKPSFHIRLCAIQILVPFYTIHSSVLIVHCERRNVHSDWN